MNKLNIPFNKACYVGHEEKYMKQAIKSKKLSGVGYFSKKCEGWFEKKIGCQKAILTPSCTNALEMTAMLINILPGDEVIMPSYTFVSTANSFVLRGAKIVFVDIRSDTMNIDENKIENAITSKTKAIVVVHYAGVGCEMDKIMKIAKKYNLYVIEDAAQGMMSKYKDKFLGTIGHFGCYSFHDTKNYTSGGEGGLLIVNDKKLVERAEIIRENGTDRKRFLDNIVDEYAWVDIGGNYLTSELQAAYLWGQLKEVNKVFKTRLKCWRIYYRGLEPLEKLGYISLPHIPQNCYHNAHMFYVKVKNLQVRSDLIHFLKRNGISAVFHYIPLHSSPFGRRVSRFSGDNVWTTKESERLIRLPLFYGLTDLEQKYILKRVYEFYDEKFKSS